MTTAQLNRARVLICRLHLHIRDSLQKARAYEGAKFAKVAAVTAADTIYHVDKLSEVAILDWFDAHWPKAWPVELVMEGTGDGDLVTFPQGLSPMKTQLKCILDPIDGTRNLMYDKRSAWILTGLAAQRGKGTNLADIEVAVMTELPTTKQWRADQLSAIRGCGPRGVVTQAMDLRTRRTTLFEARRSQAKDFRHGFASFVKFFPEGKALTAEIEEKLWRALYGADAKRSPLIFDDQYISTGGQLYELLVGHDRMIGDLRPLVFAKLGIQSSLTCHPYDICTELIFREAGGLIETPLGRRLREKLDTTSPVAWIGFANETLAREVRPVLHRLLKTLL